jgi:IPT/TIG domain
MWFVTKNNQHSEFSEAEEPSYKSAGYTLIPRMARATRKPGGRFWSAAGRRLVLLQQRQRRSHVPWLLASLLVIGLLPACSSGTSKRSTASSGGLPLLSQEVGPSGMKVHFQGGWINVPAGAVAQRQTLHIRTAPPLPPGPATRLMHPLVTGVSVDLSGLQPLRPLTIALSLRRTRPSGARPQAMFIATVPSSGSAAPVLLATRYDSASQMLIAQAGHLSSFYSVWLDGQALVGRFTRTMAEVLQIRAPQPACVGQKVPLADGSTVQFAPGAWLSGTDPLLWGCLTSSDSDPGHVMVTLTDNRPMGYSVQIAPGASVSRDPPTLDSSTARLLFDAATLGKARNLELLTPASTVHITVPDTGLPSGMPVTVGAVRANSAIVAASAAQTAFLLAAGILIPVTGPSTKALSAALDTSGNLECLDGELRNATSPGPELIVSAVQLGLQCLGTVLKGAKATLALAVLGVVTSFFSTFTGMVNLLISYFTGTDTFTVALQRNPAPTQQRPTKQPPATTQPTQQPPTQQSPAPFAATSSSPTSGPASGGTRIVIHGSGFSSVNEVVMNSIEPPLPEGSPNYNLQNLHPSFTVVSDSEIDVTTTAGAAGFTYEIDFITPTHEYFRNTFPGIPLFTYK